MRTRIFKLYRLHKIALAYSEFHIAKALSFPANDVIEVDTARHGSRREDGDRVHTGRQLLFKARRSKQWTTHILGESRSSGSRGSKPETKLEVTPLVEQKVPHGAILAADGAGAWVSAANAGKKVPLLKGVSHAKKIFTPVSRLQKKDLGDKARRFLKRQSVRGGLCKDYKKHFVLAAGDQACESQFAHIQQTSARLQGKWQENERRHTIFELTSCHRLTQRARVRQSIGKPQPLQEASPRRHVAAATLRRIYRR